MSDENIDWAKVAKNSPYPIVMLNTTIDTGGSGHYIVDELPLDTLRKMLKQASSVESAIGHSATAELLTRLLGQEIPTNRVQFQQEQDQLAVAFKLNGRITEGEILSLEQIEELGYGFYVILKT